MILSWFPSLMTCKRVRGMFMNVLERRRRCVGWVKVILQQGKAKLQYQTFVLQHEVKQNEADHSGKLNRAKESQKWPTTFRQSAMGVSIAEAGTRTAFLIHGPMGLFCVSQAWALVLRDQFSESGHGSSPQVYLRIACPPMCPKLTIEALLLLTILKHRLVLEIRFWYGIGLCKVSALPAAASDRFSQYRRRSEDRLFGHGRTWQVQSYKRPCVNYIDKYLYIYVCLCIRIPKTI